MTKLSFDYDASLDCYVAHYNDLRISARRDDCAGNPWKEWDGNIPCLSLSFGYGGRSDIAAYDDNSGIDLLRPFRGATISDAMLRRHMKAICAAFPDAPAYYGQSDNVQSFAQWLDKEARESRYHQGDCLTSIKRDLLDDALEGMGNSDKLEALASIYQAIGLPALCTSSSGYSQGDYIELLFVVTPAFRKKTGMESARKYPAEFWTKDMEAARDLFGAWAWGDVYYLDVEAPASWDSDGEPDEWESLETVGGYYGDDHGESGLAESAIQIADSIIARRDKARADAVKAVIRNRVPLALRADIIAAASVYGSAHHA